MTDIKMRQTLTREKLKALTPCSDKYLHMFGEHKSMNIEQAFDAGFNVSNICWLMSKLGKRKEIIEFANFCAKQAESGGRGARAAYWVARADALASIREEQKQFLVELLK